MVWIKFISVYSRETNTNRCCSCWSEIYLSVFLPFATTLIASLLLFCFFDKEDEEKSFFISASNVLPFSLWILFQLQWSLPKKFKSNIMLTSAYSKLYCLVASIRIRVHTCVSFSSFFTFLACFFFSFHHFPINSWFPHFDYVK